VKPKNREAMEVIQVAAGLVIAVIAAADMVGQPARLPLVLALAAGAFGAGAGIGALAEKRRARRGDQNAGDGATQTS